jgi:Plant transposon protein
VKTIQNATTPMQKLFVTAQEAKRKDIERAFGILQARFHILTCPCRLWDRNAMDTVMRTCVILHNLIIDYERNNDIDGDYLNEAENYEPLHQFVVVPRNQNQTGEEREHLTTNMMNVEAHNLIQHDLMVDRWEKWNAENGSSDDDDSNDGYDDDDNV